MAMKNENEKYSVIIPVSMNIHLAGTVRMWAKEKRVNRSKFIRNAIRYYIKALTRKEAK